MTIVLFWNNSRRGTALVKCHFVSSICIALHCQIPKKILNVVLRGGDKVSISWNISFLFFYLLYQLKCDVWLKCSDGLNKMCLRNASIIHSAWSRRHCPLLESQHKKGYLSIEHNLLFHIQRHCRYPGRTESGFGARRLISLSNKIENWSTLPHFLFVSHQIV